MTPPPTNRWRSQPVLLLQRATRRPMRRFVEELLVQEGYLCAETVDADDATDVAALLEGRALVLVNADEFTAAQQSAVVTWMQCGGRAILLAPPDALAEQLGQWSSRVHPIYNQTPPCYARFMDHESCGHHAGAVVQITTPTLLRELSGTQTVVSLGMRRDEFTAWPAVVEGDIGQGRVVIYWFDLGTCLALLRQGDPRIATTGVLAQLDHPVTYKAGYLCNGVVDPHLQDVPQADVWADLLVSQVRRLTDDLLPIPRVWQFPHNWSAMTLLDGDSDAYDWDNYAALAEPAAAAGVPYTLNVMEPHLRDMDRATAETWMRRGHDFQLHYWPDTTTATPEQMTVAVNRQQALFTEVFQRPSVGGRAHTGIWPGYTDTASALSNIGHRIETNFIPLYGGPGYRGSARPARFIDTAGRFLPLMQQPTQFMDDVFANDKGMVGPYTVEASHAWCERAYAASASKYHGVICSCLHPVPAGPETLYRQTQVALLDAILAATDHAEVGALSYRDWVDFLEARRGIQLTWSDGWRVQANVSLPGCTFLWPTDKASAAQRQGRDWLAQTTDLPEGPTVLSPMR